MNMVRVNWDKLNGFLILQTKRIKSKKNFCTCSIHSIESWNQFDLLLFFLFAWFVQFIINKLFSHWWIRAWFVDKNNCGVRAEALHIHRTRENCALLVCVLCFNTDDIWYDLNWHPNKTRLMCLLTNKFLMCSIKC